MNRINEIKQILLNELNEIKNLKKQVEKSLRKVPEGSLVISKSNGVIQYFHKTDPTEKKGKYIDKQKIKLISSLAQKDYDSAFYRELGKQESAIEKAIKNLPKKELTETHMHLAEARRKLITPYILSDEEYIKEWQGLSYVGKTFQSEYATFTTERGEQVRSKSEKIIADKLNAMGIPYRYEYPLQTVSMGIIYPDFTLLRMPEREVVYLEHFGMMDNEEYCERALLRLQEMARCGIVIGKNLITTFESTTVPLDTKMLGNYLVGLC